MTEVKLGHGPQSVAQISEDIILLEPLSVHVVFVKFLGGAIFVWIGKSQKPEIGDLSLCVGDHAVSAAGDDQSFSKYLSIHLCKANGGKPVYASINEQLGIELLERKSEFLRHLMKFLSKDM